ncbi:thiamine biosynthesis protein ThiF [Elizabethkingia argentiflava]|uniref:Molybdopterin-synthase adenylyltransferase n=1 Tax=Elizabethkingia argenteiflava TaxID=2681556 RepID=A0A845PPT8_9FLAO|nr:HesA/MoeB/ThiF family protein [Elizabethkingia argenteiflava]NAW50162.1 thiamine biosynthesis protein ThiF [Elizabethkingia argenteiflava]
MKANDIFNRYSRQIFIDEISISGQRKIMDARVLIVGAGGLGSPVIQYLAAAGVGSLGIIDFDNVELHNLNRQVIHTEFSVGKPKVESAVQFVQCLNSNVTCVPIYQKITAENVHDIISNYDIIVEGSDNFKTRYMVNDACVQLDKPLVYGSIFAFEGQVAVFNYRGSKHLRDLYPQEPSPEQVPNCDRYGVLGPLPGMVGTMMAMQVLKILTGLSVKTNHLTIIDTLDWNFMQVEF